MNKDVAILLDIFEEKGISITDFCKNTGIDRNKFYSWKSKRGNPKAEDSVLIQKWLEKNNYKQEQIETMAHEPNIPIIKEAQPLDGNQRERSLHALIESNNVLVESNKVLVETNRDLTSMLKQSYSRANSDYLSDNPEALRPLMKILALGGVNKKFWKDEHAGLLELSRILSEWQDQKQVVSKS